MNNPDSCQCEYYGTYVNGWWYEGCYCAEYGPEFSYRGGCECMFDLCQSCGTYTADCDHRGGCCGC